MRWHVAWVGLLVGGCLGGGAGDSYRSIAIPCCPVGSGELHGPLAFTPRVVRSHTGAWRDGGQDPSLRGLMFSTTNSCSGEDPVEPSTWLAVSISRVDRQAVEPGTFPVTGPDYVWLNDAGEGGPHGESCVVTLQQSGLDGGWSRRAVSGHVAFTRADPDALVGTLEVRFASEDGGAAETTMTGMFHAPHCAAGIVPGLGGD